MEKVDPARARLGEIRSSFKKRYGISTDDYQRRLASQRGACAVCGVQLMSVLDVGAGEGGKWKSRVAHVDHCHHTGKVRGLLCGCCNTGIGQLQEDPAIMRAAIDYLARNTSKDEADA